MASTLLSAMDAEGQALLTSGAAKTVFYASATVTNLVGTAGNDAFRSNGTGDTMIGGTADNTYYVYTPNDDVIQNTSTGTNTVISTVDWTLGANLENLELTNANTWGMGNSLNNILKADGANQTLNGGAGDDILTGGTSKTTFVMDAGTDHDTITNFKPGVDKVQLMGYGITDFSQVVADMTQQGANVLLTLSPTDSVLLQNHKIADFSANDFEMSIDTSQMQMTFDDEFNTLSLWNGTSGTWRTIPKGGTDEDSHHVSSDSEAAYVDSTWTGTDGKMTPINPFSVQNGILSITATKLTPVQSAENWGLEYASGLLNTKLSFSQEYGYFEVSAKMPAGQGTAPAFWLLPENGTWPPELDVVETLGNNPNTIYNTVHTDDGGYNTAIQSAVNTSNVDTAFHTYGVLWTPTEIDWYFDGVEVASEATPSDMHTPMYMVLNLGMGGAWGGGITAATPDTATMEVDYVRAYSLANSPVSGSPTPPVTTPPVVTPPVETPPVVSTPVTSTPVTTPPATTTPANTSTSTSSTTDSSHTTTTSTGTSGTSTPATAPLGFASPTASLQAANIMTGTAATTDHFSINMSDLSTSNTGIQKAILDFHNAGIWTATDNDWITLTGFSKGSTLTLDHDVSGSTELGVYRLHDAATNHDFFIEIQSNNSKPLSGGDFAFY